MQARHGIFFQSLALSDTAAEAVLPSDYRWGLIDETIIMNDSIFAVKDRRAKAYVRLADGHVCYGFLDQTGEVVYYMWITIARDAYRLVPWELNTQFALKPKTVYFWDCFTTPAHRRRGLYRSALRIGVSLAKKQGAEKSYICCMKGNTTSLDAIRDSGFRDMFEFTIRRIGPLVFCKRSGSSISVKFSIPRFDILSN